MVGLLCLLFMPIAAHAQVADGRGGQAGVNQPIGKAQPLPEYQIEQVGAWGGEVGAFVKDGNIGYVGAGQRLVVLDMSNLNDLVEIAFLRLGSVVRDIKIRDGYAYVITEGLRGGADDAGITASAFHVVDVHNPHDPQLVWSNPRESSQLFSFVAGVQLYGNLAFLQRTGGTTLRVADISNPEEPTIPLADNYVELLDTYGGYVHINDWTIQGDYAFVADRATLGFVHVYDLTTIDQSTLPFEPQRVASVPFFLNREVTGITVEGDWAYVSVLDLMSLGNNEPATELWAIDVSDPTAPVKMGEYNDFPPLANGVLPALTDLSVSDGRLYIANESGGSPNPPRDGLMVFDVAADPGQPALIGSYRTHGSVYGVVGEGDIAYLFDHGEGLIAMDCTNPASPMQLGNFHSPATPGIMRKRDDLMYISDYWNGMTILDVSDRTEPRVVGVYQTGPGGIRNAGPALDDDGYAYLAVGVGNPALEAIDISEPSLPVRIGLHQLGGAISHINALELVEIDTRKVVIVHATPFNGCPLLFSFDVTDPTDIVQLDVTCTGSPEPVRLGLGEPGTLYHTGLLWAGNTTNEVVAVDYTDPSALQVSPLEGTEQASPNDDPITAVYDPEDQMLWYTVDSSTSSDDWLHAIGLSDPAPTGTTRWWVNPGGIAVSPYGLVMLGKAEDLLGHGMTSILLMNTDDPSSPRLLASAPLPFPNASEAGSPQSDVVADGSGLYVAKSFQIGEDSNTGLAIFDVRSTVDRNRDGRINTQDLAYFLKEARSMSPSADLNGDGRIDHDDVALFVRMYLG